MITMPKPKPNKKATVISRSAVIDEIGFDYSAPISAKNVGKPIVFDYESKEVKLTTEEVI
jgi:hypothetical protein